MNNVQYELICVIINFSKGSKIIKQAKTQGVSGATILLGKGTANDYFSKLFGLTDIRKEIVLMVVKKDSVTPTLNYISKKFHFDKPNHGIAFTISVNNLLGVRNCDYKVEENIQRSQETNMYKAIFIVVDKGKAETVLDSAIAAGSKGATIINGRGSGIHEQKILFNFPIEPEKEIVLIITAGDLTNKVIEAIRNDLYIDEPGKGIMFILDINQAYGLY